MRLVLRRATHYHPYRLRRARARRAVKGAIYTLAFAIGIVLGSLLVKHPTAPRVQPPAAFQHAKAVEHAAADTFGPWFEASRGAPQTTDLRPSPAPRGATLPVAPLRPRPAPSQATASRDFQFHGRPVAQPSPKLSQPAGPALRAVPAPTPDSTGIRPGPPPQPLNPMAQPSLSNVTPSQDVSPVHAYVSEPPVKSQGLLVAVNDDAQTFSVSGNGGMIREFRVTPGTIIYVGPQHVAFARLHEFVGSPISVWSIFLITGPVAGRVVLLVGAAAAGPGSASGGGTQLGILPSGEVPGVGGGGGSGGSSGGSSSGGTSGGGSGGGSSGGLGGLGGLLEHVGSILK